MNADAVFEGGGVKTIGFVGAAEVLEERGYCWNRLAGTSAGAMIAALLAAGYQSKEIREMLYSLNFSLFQSKDFWNRVPVVGNGLALWFRYGIYRGDELEKWVAERLAAKQVRTFADLPDGKLQIIASDISNGRLLILPQDIKAYGMEPNKLDVAFAVRMSTSLPYYFRPVVLKVNGKKVLIVDGGVLSNYPVWLFDTEHEREPRWPTFGFRLSAARQVGEKASPNKINNPLQMAWSIYRTMLKAHDRLHIEEQDAVRTIFIPTGDVNTTDFDLTDKQRNYLYHSGHEAAEKFIRRWDFAVYKQMYRQAVPVMAEKSEATAKSDWPKGGINVNIH